MPDFLLAITTNLLLACMFAARVHAPSLAGPLGVATLVTAIPAAGLIAANVTRARPLIESAPASLWIVFIVTTLMLDYVLHVEFRSPTRWGILVPFLVLYIASTTSLWAATWQHGTTLYLVTAVTFVLQGALSFYARAHE